MSDIHYNFDNYDTLRMRDKTVEYLVSLQTKFDFILITGDIRYKGVEYSENIFSFINSLSHQLQIPKENFFIVPGNHDIKRSKLRTTIVNGILSSHDPVNEINELDVEIYNELLKGQDDFLSFYKRALGREYPKEQLHFTEERSGYNIIGINTCFLCCKDGEEGSLLIGQKRINNVLKKIKRDHVNIAIGHHNIDCLNQIEKNLLLNNFSDYSVNLYLSGHMHQPYVTFETNNINDIYMFGCGSGVSDNLAAVGIITGRIDLDQKSGNVTFHKWEPRKEYWHIANDITRKAPNGVYNFSFSSKKNVTTSGTISSNKEDLHTTTNFFGPINGQVHTGNGDIVIKK
jgi:predicted MPP superfamily phosphohydrolase